VLVCDNKEYLVCVLHSGDDGADKEIWANYKYTPQTSWISRI